MNTHSPPIWQWPIQDIRRVVEHVRAGQDLTPSSWPDDGRVAVGLSFDVDTETNWLWNGRHSPASLSRGEYGARTGLPRILDTLNDFEVPATFFIPAVTGLLHPEVAPAILKSGEYEIGIHGWIHESVGEVSEADERALTTRAFEYWTNETGTAPAGIRTPSWDFSAATLSIIQDLGLLYDSSLMADDRPYELLEHGQPTGIIELPVEWLLDDYPYFQIDWVRNARPYIGPDDVYPIWQAEFDRARAEGTLFILTMHPQIIGHRSRMAVLERLIQYMRSVPDVWFATMGDIARYVREQRGESAA